MPHDHLVRKQALKYYKKWILHSSNIGIFSEGLTQDFGQKMKILSTFVLGQNRPGNSVLRIFEVENNPSLTVKILFFIDATLFFFLWVNR